MTNDNESEAEELLQQSKDQSRHTSEPTSQPPATPSTPDRTDAIKAALLAIDAGDRPENINIRDKRLKALLVGLEDADELDDVVADLATALESDVAVDEATQSDVARLLIRVGLQEAVPEILDDAMEARQQALMEQATDF